MQAVPPEVLIEFSNQIDTYIERSLEAERAAFRRGHRAGYPAGYAQAVADLAEDWRSIAGPVSRGQQLRSVGWERRLGSAEAASARVADEHWRDFIRRAADTQPEERSDQQRSVLALERQQARARSSRRHVWAAKP